MVVLSYFTIPSSLGRLIFGPSRNALQLDGFDGEAPTRGYQTHLKEPCEKRSRVNVYSFIDGEGWPKRKANE
jgi:hypothetical protein